MERVGHHDQFDPRANRSRPKAINELPFRGSRIKMGMITGIFIRVSLSFSPARLSKSRRSRMTCPNPSSSLGARRDTRVSEGSLDEDDGRVGSRGEDTTVGS